MYRRFSYLLTFSLGLLFSASAVSQLDYVDSLKKRLDTTHAVDAKVKLLVDIIGVTFDRANEVRYAEQAIELAEESRDQRLIVQAYLGIGRHQTTWLTSSGSRTFQILQTKTTGCTRSRGLITKESGCRQLSRSQIFIVVFICSLSLVLLYHENGPLQPSLINVPHSL